MIGIYYSNATKKRKSSTCLCSQQTFKGISFSLWLIIHTQRPVNPLGSRCDSGWWKKIISRKKKDSSSELYRWGCLHWSNNPEEYLTESGIDFLIFFFGARFERNLLLHTAGEGWVRWAETFCAIVYRFGCISGTYIYIYIYIYVYIHAYIYIYIYTRWEF